MQIFPLVGSSAVLTRALCAICVTLLGYRFIAAGKESLVRDLVISEPRVPTFTDYCLDLSGRWCLGHASGCVMVMGPASNVERASSCTKPIAPSMEGNA